METGLKERVVLITGASGGIGRCLVESFIAEGARVAAHFNSGGAMAEKLFGHLPKHRIFLTQADLTDEKQVLQMWESIETGFGPVEILIANAGVCLGYGTSIEEMELEQWNKTIATNLTSVFLCMRSFFHGIRKFGIQEPSAVLIGSTAGIYGEALNSDYAASKAPLNSGFLLSLKNEIVKISPRGRVNAICPSWTITDMVKSQLDDKDHVRKVLQTVALRKVGRPIDVASSAVFLASSKTSGHCSGQVVTVAGGMEGRMLYNPDEIDVSHV